jgi:hypothetical protein
MGDPFPFSYRSRPIATRSGHRHRDRVYKCKLRAINNTRKTEHHFKIWV